MSAARPAPSAAAIAAVAAIGAMRVERRSGAGGASPNASPISRNRFFGSFSRQRTLDELHHESGRAGILEAVDGGDVRMVQRGEDLRFPLETGAAVGIHRVGIGQQLDGDLATEFRIARAIDFAHAAHPEKGDNLVRADTRTYGLVHVYQVPRAILTRDGWVMESPAARTAIGLRRAPRDRSARGSFESSAAPRARDISGATTGSAACQIINGRF
jgi:hypothetical protein